MNWKDGMLDAIGGVLEDCIGIPKRIFKCYCSEIYFCESITIVPAGRKKPVAETGYSIFIYDLTDESEGLAKLGETYVKAGIKPPR